MDTGHIYWESVGRRIKERREFKSYTQTELARRISVKREIINYWEHGRRTISAEKLIILSEELDTSIDYLLGKTDIRTYNCDSRYVERVTGLSEKSIDIITGSEYKGIIDLIIKEPEFLKLLAIFDVGISAKDILDSALELQEAGSNAQNSTKQMELLNKIGFRPCMKQGLHEIIDNLFDDLTHYNK